AAPAEPERARQALRGRLVEQVLAAYVGHLPRLHLPGSSSSAPPSTHGTLVTATCGSNSSLAFRRRAVWLWSRFCHQCATTYSGITIEITSPGFSLTSPRTYRTSGRTVSR